jgi:uncharacterized protein (DUF1800 family)
MMQGAKESRVVNQSRTKPRNIEVLFETSKSGGRFWKMRGRSKVLFSSVLAAVIAGQGLASALPSAAVAATSVTAPPVVMRAASPARPSANEASRFLVQATFGARAQDVTPLRDMGFAEWIKRQQAMPFQRQAVAYMVERDKSWPNQLTAANFYEYFTNEAVNAPDQLRQRMRFALSQIFVVSFADPGIRPIQMASFYDVLGKHAFGNYRQLMEEVTFHPAMTIYLTSMGNMKEDPAAGRLPDENYARELLQLFTIGLYELNLDGTLKLDAQGRPIETYRPEDIAGLAKVFTGIGWATDTPTARTFIGLDGWRLRRDTTMIYNQFHSTSEKRFLGKVIPASAKADTLADVRAALDIVFNHPNVGPFVSRQLIQRFVTSNPSPAYVKRVATVFNDNGAGVRGDLAAVTRAILLDPEARDVDVMASPGYGKLREPLLRLTQHLRAFGGYSRSGFWQLGNTSGSASLGQAPMTSPSVFNFYRPGYTPPNTLTGAANMVAPEMQIVDEITVAGYLNTLQVLFDGRLGYYATADIQARYTAEMAVAHDPAALVEHMNRTMLYGTMSPVLRQRMMTAVTSIAIPVGAAGTQSAINAALLRRAKAAALLTMASPDFIVQR